MRAGFCAQGDPKKVMQLDVSASRESRGRKACGRPTVRIHIGGYTIRLRDGEALELADMLVDAHEKLTAETPDAAA